MDVYGFYCLSPVELYYALQDHAEQKNYDYEVFVKTIWESTRTTLLHIYGQNPNIKKRPKKATDVFRLPWDKIKMEQMSVEEMKKAILAIHARYGKKKSK